MRIGYEDADTLITYPHAHNLSACAQPIRIRGWADQELAHRARPRRNAPAQEISVDWWCTMIRRDSPEVAGAHTLDSSEAPPSQRTR